MSAQKQVITPEVEIVGYDEGNGDEEIEIPVVTLIERLQKALSEIPEEHRNSAVLHVWTSGDYARAYVDMRYCRPETDEEYQERTGREQAWKRQWEERERRELARLKAKFEGP